MAVHQPVGEAIVISDDAEGASLVHQFIKGSHALGILCCDEDSAVERCSHVFFMQPSSSVPKRQWPSNRWKSTGMAPSMRA
jgi:hypothetical protein